MKIFKPHYILSILLLFSYSFNSAAQNYADSLKAIIENAQNDTLCVETLNKLSDIYQTSNPKVALEYALKAEKIAKNCKYNDGIASSFYNIGELYYNKGNFELSINSFDNCIEIYKQLDNRIGLINSYNSKGLVYLQQKQYDLALRYYNKSLRINRVAYDSTRIADSYAHLGLVYARQGRYDKALIQFYNSLRLKETLNDKYGMALSYGNIGIIYFEIESYDQSLINLERGLRIFENLNNEKGIADALLYLGEIYQKQKTYHKAVDALNRSLRINIKNSNTVGIADAYLKMGDINTLIGKHPKAYDNYMKSFDYYNEIQNFKGIVNTRLALAKYYYSFDDLENSKSQLIKIVSLSKQNNLLKQELEISKLLANIYLQQENFYRASATLLRASVITDLLHVKNMDKEITQIQMQFEFDKKMQNKEIEAVRLKSGNQLRIQKYKTIQGIVIIVLFLISIIAYVLYKKNAVIKRKNIILEERKKRINTQVEELRVQKEALTKANTTKNRFLSIIGNDLRHPFNGINSFIAVITDSKRKLDEKTLSKYLYLIKDSGRKAMSLLDNLLEWTKANNDEFVAHYQPVSINSIIRGNILLIKEVSLQKNIEIIEELDSNPNVYADKNMINTVISNLLSNALKFTNSEGKIWIKTVVKNDEVKIVIQDTGIGMPEEDLNNIFNPSENTDTIGAKSSGLGLILCKEFLQHHRQELRIDSKLDFGTTLWFYLPVGQ